MVFRGLARLLYGGPEKPSSLGALFKTVNSPHPQTSLAIPPHAQLGHAQLGHAQLGASAVRLKVSFSRTAAFSRERRVGP